MPTICNFHTGRFLGGLRQCRRLAYEIMLIFSMATDKHCSECLCGSGLHEYLLVAEVPCIGQPTTRVYDDFVIDRDLGRDLVLQP